MSSRLTVIAAAASAALPWVSAPLVSAQFTYRPPGELESPNGGASRPGAGREDDRVYAPGIRFPIESGRAYANSQIYGHGGYMGPGGGQCDAENYSYPWYDNYCEERSWSMPLCPSGAGHQGQDIRPETCADAQHWAVAAVDGTITNVGSYSLHLTADDGTRFDYLHMRSLAVSTGQRVTRGQRLGRVSDNFGSTATTVHLHFNIRQNVSGVGSVFVPPYMSLVRAYEDLVGSGSSGGSTARSECGNARVEAGEGCDDGALFSGDGCDRGCNVEQGWQCSGSPSRCWEDGSSSGGGSSPGSGDDWCGDGRIDSGEECDDDNIRSGDGCDSSCREESGWRCRGEPSACSDGSGSGSRYPECGDGFIDSGEECDDYNIRDGDGCSGDCWLERGWDCWGEPTECTEHGDDNGEFGGQTDSFSECGNGRVEYGEECDNDRDRSGGDGCNYSCRIESGWRCTGDPSRCEMVSGEGFCGDGWIEEGEACDDDNSQGGDGCSTGCRIESGYRCSGAGVGSCATGASGSSSPPTACTVARRGSAGGGAPAFVAGMLLAWLGRRRGSRRRAGWP